MAKTIGTLAYKIVADTSSFTKGVTVSRKELKVLGDIFEATRTDAERYQAAHDSLVKAMVENKLDVDTGTRALEMLYKEYQHLFPVEEEQVEHLNDISEAMENLVPAELVDMQSTAVGNFNNELGKLTPITADTELRNKTLVNTFGGMVPVINPATIAMHGFSKAMQLASDVSAFFVESLTDAFAHIQDVGNTSQSLGIAIDELQVLQFAADQADIEFETLTKAMYSTQKAIADAVSGSGSLADAFDELGLDAEALSTKSLDEQFRAVVGALGDVENATTRAGLAADIFGKSALDMERLVQAGAEGFAQSREFLSESGMVTQEMVDDVDELDAAWKKLQKTLDGFRLLLAKEMAKPLQKLLEDTEEFLSSEDNRKAIAEFAHDIGLLASAFAAVAHRVAQARGVMAGIKNWVMPDWLEGFIAVVDMAEADPQQAISVATGKLGIDTGDDAAAQVAAEAANEQIATDWMAAIDEQVRAADELRANEQAMHEQRMSQEAEFIEAVTRGDEMLADDARKVADEWLRGIDEQIEAADKLKQKYADDNDKLLSELEDIAEAREQGIISGEQADEFARKAMARGGGKGPSEFRNPAAMRGSQEALSAIARAQFGGRETRSEKTLDKILDELREANRNNKEKDAEQDVNVEAFV